MPKRGDGYDEEFRAGAVRIVSETEKFVAVTARDLGVNPGTTQEHRRLGREQVADGAAERQAGLLRRPAAQLDERVGVGRLGDLLHQRPLSVERDGADQLRPAYRPPTGRGEGLPADVLLPPVLRRRATHHRRTRGRTHQVGSSRSSTAAVTAPYARCGTMSATHDEAGQVRGSVTPSAVIGPLVPASAPTVAAAEPAASPGRHPEARAAPSSAPIPTPATSPVIAPRACTRFERVSAAPGMGR